MLIFMLTSAGCNTAHKALMKEKMETKKEKYETLLKDLADNKDIYTAPILNTIREKMSELEGKIYTKRQL